MERRTFAPRPAGRPPVSPPSVQLVRELQELIAALDRRVPQVERVGEFSIAHDAAALRERAVARLAELGVTPPTADR